MRFQNPSPLFTILFIFLPPLLLGLTPIAAQPPGISARALDALLQSYAFKSLDRPKTGVPYDAGLPENLAGIGASAIRLRSGSLRTRGVRSYREFRIPTGVIEQPYAKRVVLVYHNLGNWSSLFYPLPGFDYLGPVLGLLGYDASNLSATDLPELEIRASEKPISISFPNFAEKNPNSSPNPRCVFFDLQGSVEFEEVSPGNVCNVFKQGHVSIVMESGAPGPGPEPWGAASGHGKGRGRDRSKGWKIFGSLIGVLVLMGLVVLAVLRVKEYQNERRKKEKEKEEEVKRRSERRGEGEALEITSFGNIRAPFATVSRTQPVLEDHYVP
ncbi:hypothetical protein PanWU01x14_063490 [Parasponia andersonii]|uniref:Transmembrane protein n=1 Tax=Parasponia andersonii TaxID=3476 RepID=A0A2P5DHZ6_PARAD|nr:hypothetical protein PanWU01x14_063490 [Parasponia andersonii]